eukprot:gene31765-41229_t
MVQNDSSATINRRSLRELLSVLASNFDFSACANVEDEFSVVKKAYFKQALIHHPDKGGYADKFRIVQASFEAIRAAFESKRITSFSDLLSSSLPSLSSSSSDQFDYSDFERNFTPSYDFYSEMAKEPTPMYKVELAKSSRSQCSAEKCTPRRSEGAFIEKGSIRFGSLDKLSGTYTRWRHMACWRVPAAVWIGLPQRNSSNFTEAEVAKALCGMNEVVFTGFSDLPKEDKAIVISYIMDTNNWSRGAHRKPTDIQSEPVGSSFPNPPAIVIASSDVTIVMSKRLFEAPVPGRNGATALSLVGKTVVLTGVFPEVGGGAGLNLGKERLKLIVDSFGGRVTSKVSGCTDILVVGKEPGAKKVLDARSNGRVKMISVQDLKLALESGQHFDSYVPSAPLLIESFSRGYMDNSITNRLSAAEIEFAREGSSTTLRLTEATSTANRRAAAAAVEVKEVGANVAKGKDVIAKMKVAELKAELKKRGASDYGSDFKKLKKAKLVEKLKVLIEADESPAAAAAVDVRLSPPMVILVVVVMPSESQTSTLRDEGIADKQTSNCYLPNTNISSIAIDGRIIYWDLVPEALRASHSSCQLKIPCSDVKNGPLKFIGNMVEPYGHSHTLSLADLQQEFTENDGTRAMYILLNV